MRTAFVTALLPLVAEACAPSVIDFEARDYDHGLISYANDASLPVQSEQRMAAIDEIRAFCGGTYWIRDESNVLVKDGKRWRRLEFQCSNPVY